ncbi:MAG: NAD-dependent epimerase/dehydratase family protein, partial [Burkholderiaceae bacterium]
MKVLMTGAAGGVGTFLRPLLLKACGETYLSDLQPVKDLQPGEHFRAADVSDPTAVQAAVPGMDAIIHLGGHSVEA